MCLGVKVYEKYALAQSAESAADVKYRGCFPHSTLLVGYGNDLHAAHFIKSGRKSQLADSRNTGMSEPGIVGSFLGAAGLTGLPFLCHAASRIAD